MPLGHANGIIMVRTFMIAAVSIAALALSATAFAQQSGTSAEAKAMLLKAVAAVKADKAKALDMFNKGKAGFSTATFTFFARMWQMARPSPLVTPTPNSCWASTQGPTRMPLARRTVRNSTTRIKSRKSNHRGRLRVSTPRRGQDAGRQGEPRNEDRRSRLRRRLLQVGGFEPGGDHSPRSQKNGLLTLHGHFGSYLDCS